MLYILKDRYYHTTRDLMLRTGSCNVHTDIHELRQNGYDISCRYEGMSVNGTKIYSYRLEIDTCRAASDLKNIIAALNAPDGSDD